MRAEGTLDLIALVQSQKAGVDEDAGELIADRFVDKAGGNG